MLVYQRVKCPISLVTFSQTKTRNFRKVATKITTKNSVSHRATVGVFWLALLRCMAGISNDTASTVQPYSMPFNSCRSSRQLQCSAGCSKWILQRSMKISSVNISLELVMYFPDCENKFPMIPYVRIRLTSWTTQHRTARLELALSCQNGTIPRLLLTWQCRT